MELTRLADLGMPYALIDGRNTVFAIKLMTEHEANEENENMPIEATNEDLFWVPIELHLAKATT